MSIFDMIFLIKNLITGNPTVNLQSNTVKFRFRQGRLKGWVFDPRKDRVKDSKKAILNQLKKSKDNGIVLISFDLGQNVFAAIKASKLYLNGNDIYIDESKYLSSCSDEQNEPIYMQYGNQKKFFEDKIDEYRKKYTQFQNDIINQAKQELLNELSGYDLKSFKDYADFTLEMCKQIVCK